MNLPPLRPELVDRSALVGRILGRPGRSVVLVSAPAGFGKSVLGTLTAHRFLAQGGKAGWRSLEPEDADPARFWSGTARALQGAGVGPEPVTALLGALGSPQGPGLRETAEALAEAVNAEEIPLLIVFDDLHLLPGGPVLDSLVHFAEALHHRSLVLLLSRTDLPLPCGRLRAQGVLEELRAEDLRFTEPEASQVLGRLTSVPLSADQRLRLWQKTEGWAAGLQLAALSLGRGSDPETFLRSFSGNDRMILEFLTEEVVSQQPDDLRQTLFRLAVLDRWDAELIDAVASPQGGAADFLRTADASNLFIISLDEGRWYRFHHLFGETLRARLRTLAPSTEGEVLLRAAEFEEARGRQEAALGLWLRLGRKDRAATCLSSIDLMARGEMTLLLNYLDQIGPETLQHHVHLVDRRHWAKLFLGRTAEAVGDWEAARDVPWAPEAARYLEGSGAALRAFVALLRGETTAAVALARQADVLLDQHDYYPRSILPFVVGTDLRSRGKFDDACAALEGITRCGRALGSIWTIAQGFYERGVTLVLAGRFREAEEIVLQGLAEAEARRAGHFGTVARLQALAAELRYERNDLAGARTRLEPILGPALRSDLPLAALEILVVQSKVLAAEGRADQAGIVFHQALRLRSRGGALPRVVAQTEEAEWRRTAPGRRAVPGPPTYPAEDPITAFPRETGIVVYLLRSGDRAAESRARNLATASRLQGWGRTATLAECCLAWSIDQGGRRQEALGLIRARLPEVDAEDWKRLATDLGPEVESLFEGARHPDRNDLAAQISPREAEVLRLLGEGLTNQGIADRLFISEATVKTHVHHLARKLEASNRLVLVARAREKGLL